MDDALSKIVKNIHDWTPQKAQDMHNNSMKFSQENFSKQLLSRLASNMSLSDN